MNTILDIRERHEEEQAFYETIEHECAAIDDATMDEIETSHSDRGTLLERIHKLFVYIEMEQFVTGDDEADCYVTPVDSIQKILNGLD